MSHTETSAAPELEAAPVKNKVGRPRKGAVRYIKSGKPRKPYGMKDSQVFENKGATEHKNKDYRGFSGKCVRIKIISNSYEPRFPQIVDVKLGDLPQVHIVVNQEVIVPIEALGVLNDTAVDIPASGVLAPYSSERETETFVRIPTQVLGTATWEEYEAQLATQRSKPLSPARNF